MPINTKAAGAAVAAAAVLGLGIAGVARADDQGTTTPAPSSTGTSTTDPDAATGERGKGAGHDGMRGAAMKGQMAADLAEKLGLDEAEVEDALEAVRDDLRAQRPDGDQGRPSAADRDARRDAMVTALATELGVDKTKVETALEDIRQEKQAEHFAEREAELTERLDDAVADGTLTRAEADAVLKAAKAGVIGMGGRGPR